VIQIWPRLRWPPDSIGVRLILWYALWTVALIAAGSGLVYGGLETQLERVQDERVLADHLRILKWLLRSSPPPLSAQSVEVLSPGSTANSYVHVRIFGPSGQILLETPEMAEHVPRAEAPFLGRLDTEEGELSIYRSASGRLFEVLTARIETGIQGGQTHYVQIALDRTDDDLLDQVRDHSWILMTCSVLACAVVGYTIAQRSIRPVEKIGRTIQRIHANRLHERIDTRDLPRELAGLADTFNSMLDRLSSAFTSVSQFSDNAAHELRTPVANLQNELEISLQKARTPGEHREVVLSCLEECGRIDRILQSLLFLARNSAPFEGPLTSVALEEEVASLIELYEPWASDAGIEIRSELPDESAVPADPTLLRQALANLIANALEHTSHGGRIQIRAERSETEVKVSVSDTGCGISIENVPHVCDRFFRAETSRSSSRQHLGLGLSIVQGIMHKHHGHVEIDSVLGQGTCVSLHFPL